MTVTGHNLLSFPADSVLATIGKVLTNERLVSRAVGRAEPVIPPIGWTQDQRAHSAASLADALPVEVRDLELNFIGHTRKGAFVVGHWRFDNEAQLDGLVEAWTSSGMLARVAIVRCLGCGTATGSRLESLKLLHRKLRAARTAIGLRPVEVWGTREPCAAPSFGPDGFARAQILVRVDEASEPLDAARSREATATWFSDPTHGAPMATTGTNNLRRGTLAEHMRDRQVTTPSMRWPVFEVEHELLAAALSQERVGKQVAGLLALPELEVVARVPGSESEFLRSAWLLDSDYVRLDAGAGGALLVKMDVAFAALAERLADETPISEHVLALAP